MLKPQFIYTCTAVIIFLLIFISYSNAENDVKNNLMKYYEKGQTTELESMNTEGVNAFIKDIVFSNDPDSPITCGLFRMEKGKSLQYNYTYDEAKIILEGEMTISEEGGDTVEAKAGDILYIGKGAKMTFSSNSYGLEFYCGQRAAEAL